MLKRSLAHFAAALFWLSLFLIHLVAWMVVVVANTPSWRWSALGVAFCTSGASLLAARSRKMAKGLTLLSLSHWEESYERDYSSTVGLYSGPAVLGVLSLAFVLIGALFLLFG